MNHGDDKKKDVNDSFGAFLKKQRPEPSPFLMTPQALEKESERIWKAISHDEETRVQKIEDFGRSWISKSLFDPVSWGLGFGLAAAVVFAFTTYQHSSQNPERVFTLATPASIDFVAEAALIEESMSLDFIDQEDEYDFPDLSALSEAE